VDLTDTVKKGDKASGNRATTRIVPRGRPERRPRSAQVSAGAGARFRVVGETADGLSVVSLVDRLKPEVLIVDVAMPGLYGLEIARQVRGRSPKTAVIVLSRYVNEWYVTEALRNGAAGYVVKQAEARSCRAPSARWPRGGAISARRCLPRTCRRGCSRRSASRADSYEMLTGREREVLQLVARATAHRASRAGCRSALRTRRRIAPTSCASCG